MAEKRTPVRLCPAGERTSSAILSPAMHHVIQYYAPAAANALPDFETVETQFEVLSDVEAQALRDVGPGGPYLAAEAFEIIDRDCTDSDPAVASWRRKPDA